MADQRTAQTGRRGGGRDQLPVVPRLHAELSPAERAQCAAVARDALPQDAVMRDRLFFGPRVQAGLGGGPFLVFGDSGEIPLLARFGGGGILEYRLSMLAGDGDVVVIGGHRNRAFEDYAETYLGLGRRRYLEVPQAPNGRYAPAQIRCLKDDATFAALRAIVAEAGGATLVPHLSTAAIWALARRLAIETGTRVQVAGPPPSLSRLANDKAAFSRIVRAVFGEAATPREVLAHNAAALTARVHALARDCRELVLKLPDSAGSAGNFPVFSDDVAGLSPKALHRHLKAQLARTGVPPSFPMLVQIWQENVLTSPSLQLWIPDKAEGRPVIEGVFHQRLTGAEGRFAGAAPADPGDGWVARFCHDGLMLGQVFQDLGYFGRCSFDAVLSGPDLGDPAPHWLECNGRWGGVSIPMTLLNRLFPDGALPAYTIAHESGLDLPRRSFAEGMEILGDLLWSPGAGRGVIFLTPVGFEQGSGLHFISLGGSAAEAAAQADAVIERLSAPR